MWTWDYDPSTLAPCCELMVDPKYLSDAAHFPGGHAAGIEVPRHTSEIPAIVRHATAILPIGAQSSLTGGATPMGETLLSTEKLTHILDVSSTSITVEAGVTITAIQEALDAHGAWFPAGPHGRGRLPVGSSPPTPPAPRLSNTALDDMG